VNLAYPTLNATTASSMDFKAQLPRRRSIGAVACSKEMFPMDNDELDMDQLDFSDVHRELRSAQYQQVIEDWRTLQGTMKELRKRRDMFGRSGFQTYDEDLRDHIIAERQVLIRAMATLNVLIAEHLGLVGAAAVKLK
jgi:hypothetical protein